MLSWDLINSVPIKTANMDIDAARKLCVDFFRISKNALWITDSAYQAFKDGKVVREMEANKIYAGLPYITLSHGNIYRLMDYINPETGVVDVQAAGKKQELFGNQCSGASFWGWGRVINSAKFSWTKTMVHNNGFLRLGSYTYDDTVYTIMSEQVNTKDILKANGSQTMYQSYAQLKAGDGIVYFTSAGHVVMITEDAHVEYKADGTIDPSKSYVMVIDQAGTWTEGTNEAGDSFIFAANTDVKWTFLTLFNKQYMPFTFAEWLGTDPIEETVISYSHTGETISLLQLKESVITCNYALSDAYVIIKDQDGKEVYKQAIRPRKINQKEMAFALATPVDKEYCVTWGSLDDLDKTKEYTVEIIAQVATGERPTLWTGKLAQ